MYTLPLSIFNINLVHLHDVTTSQGESIYLIKKNKQTNKNKNKTHTHTQLTPYVLDAELDCCEDFWKKILSQ